jgi:hypothetical protein
VDTPEILVEKANQLHRKAEAARRNSIRYAKEAGDNLLAAKEKLKHGEWKPWLKKHFEASYETAVLYMRLAKGCNWERIKEELDTNKHLSLNAALASIRFQIKGIEEQDRKAEQRRIEAGWCEHAIQRLGLILKQELENPVGWTEHEVIYLAEQSFVNMMFNDELRDLHKRVRKKMASEAIQRRRQRRTPFPELAKWTGTRNPAGSS